MTKAEILTPPKTIAVVGLSDNPLRPSYQVAHYLLEQGFAVIPVNPTVAEVLDQKSYPNLSALPSPDQIDIVDVFRQPDAVLAIVQEILNLGITPVVWLQEGVIAPEAKTLAEQAGLTVIMDECIKKEHYKLQKTD